jgi:hypothetical protein
MRITWLVDAVGPPVSGEGTTAGRRRGRYFFAGS